MRVLWIWQHACTREEGRHQLITGEHTHRCSRSGWTDVRTFGCVEAPEVGRPVDDDALNRHVEAEVKTPDAVGLEDFGEAVAETGELPLRRALTDVGGESRPGEVQRVDEAERGGPGCAAGRQVTGEVAPELCFLIHSTEEDLLVLVLEGEVEGLGGEVTDHVGQVASPEGNEALLLWDPDHTVHDAFVLHLCGDLSAGMLDLQAETIQDLLFKIKKVHTTGKLILYS